MELQEALGVAQGDVVAFVGAGGKSSAIVLVARELTERGYRVIAAPTTKMFLDEAKRIGPLAVAGDRGELIEAARTALSDSGAIVAGSGMLSKQRIGGVEPGWVPDLAELADVVLVEADGSRRKPLKAPADHEPELPDGTTLVVAVGGIRALGASLDEEQVHRARVFSELTGIGIGHTITAAAFARALAAGLRSVPDGTGKAALLTGVEPGSSMSGASVVARELWRLGIRKVAAGTVSEDHALVWTM